MLPCEYRDEAGERIGFYAYAALFETRRCDACELAQAVVLGKSGRVPRSALRVARSPSPAAPASSRRRPSHAAKPALHRWDPAAGTRDIETKGRFAKRHSPTIPPLSHPFDITRFFVCRLQNELFLRSAKCDQAGTHFKPFCCRYGSSSRSESMWAQGCIAKLSLRTSFLSDDDASQARA